MKATRVSKPMIDIPTEFRNFSALCASGGFWKAAVQASFKLSEYAGIALSRITVVSRKAPSPWLSGTSRGELLSGSSVFEKDFLNTFSDGIWFRGKGG